MFPLFPGIIPWIPTNCTKPPTVYALMNSIANFDTEDKTKIQELAKTTHSKFFNFPYPLSEHINKEDFEVMILNHFIMRRIGYETFTAFQIALNVKMNEIMPYFNKMFDFLDGWDLFNDGEKVTTKELSGRNTTSNGKSNNTTNSTITDETIADLRNSEMPQNKLEDIRNGSYLSGYDYNTTNSSSNTESSVNTSDNTETKEDSNRVEEITRSPGNKIEIYQAFMKDINNIYSMIFKELDVLFYGLI